MKLRPYQELIRNFILSNERCNVFAGMGTGKTLSTLESFYTLKVLGLAKRLLVIAPKRVARYTWPDEIGKWGYDLTIAVAIGTAKQRKDAALGHTDIVAINYENLPWLVELLGEAWPFDMVVADESTRLKGLRIHERTSKKGKEFVTGQGSSRAKAIARVAHRNVKRWVNLTGSPAPNGLKDLWGQHWFVDRGKSLGVTFGAFSERWFRQIPTPEGYTRIEPTRYAKDEIEKLMKPHSITIDAKDWFDIADPIEVIVPVKLPDEARRVYNEMEEELFTTLDDGLEVEVFGAGAKSNKCLQIASGGMYVDKQKTWVELHDEKIEALRSIVEETNGAPLLVTYQYVPQREAILKAFPKARTLEHGPNIIKQFCRGEIPMLVLHPQSAGHGLSLQDNCWILVDFAVGWNLEEDEQVIERIGPTRQKQSGYDRAVYRYRILAEDTIEDLVVMPTLQRKCDVQTSFKNAMKLRGLTTV